MRTLRIATILCSVILAIGCWAKEGKTAPPVPVKTPMPAYPAQFLEEGLDGSVELRVGVEPNGMVEKVWVLNSTDSRFEQTCVEAIGRWTFKPALYLGKPLKTVYDVTFEFRGGKVLLGKVRDPLENQVLPKVLKRVNPTYPAELVASGNAGKVDIEFVVDPQGNVTDPKVIETTHPLFEAPAVAALLQWKFTPGTMGGKPVSTNVRQAILFGLDGEQGVDAFSIDRKRKGKAPGAPKADVPPKTKVTVSAVHPYESAIAGKKGTAEVKILVGPDGCVLGTVIVSASEPEFGLALAAAMEAWTFDPALLDKNPTVAVINRRYEFETRSRDSAIDDETASLAVRIRKGKFTPAKPKELDAPLKPTFAAAPIYPTVLLDKEYAGSAKIEVVVDKKGRAVLPRIVEASEPEFGWAAATAAQRWLFDPPTVGKKPVEVVVSIPFKFEMPKANLSAPAN